MNVTITNDIPTHGDRMTVTCANGFFLDPSASGETQDFTCVETSNEDSNTRVQEWNPSNVMDYTCTGQFDIFIVDRFRKFSFPCVHTGCP